MKPSILFYLTLALIPAFCAQAHAQAPQAPSSYADENLRAVSYLGMISAWRQQPAIVARLCEPVDPSGAAGRKAVYDAWASNNRETLAKIDVYVRELAPRLMPAKTADPLKEMDNFVLEGVNSAIGAMPAEQKLRLCQNYRNLPMVSTEKTRSVTNEAFADLEKWKRAHPK